MNLHASRGFLYILMNIQCLDFHQVPMEMLSIIQTIHRQVQMMVTNVFWNHLEHHKITLLMPIKMPMRPISMRIAPTRIRQTHWPSIQMEMHRVQHQTRQNIKFDIWSH